MQRATTAPADESAIHSVTQVVSAARAVLDDSFPLLWVRGELSNLAQPASGHLYFTLKDATAQARCALFRNRRLPRGFVPANGQQVLACVRVTLYEPRGEFQLMVESLEPDGAGAQRLAFEQLKRRLAAEGLFDPALKRPPPAFPRQVGLITSPTGAAVRDLIAVFGRRFPALPLLIYPAQVQGAAAPASLVAALALANARADCDVLILARGGGSQEDLSAFNDETLARAIRASAIPVVSGVGHEIDLTLADLAADRRAATPSAAAELVAPQAEHVAQRLDRAGQRLHTLIAQQIAAGRSALDGRAGRLARAGGEQVHRARERLRRAVAGLDARSPLATLARGYAVVTRAADGVLVRSVEQAPPGTRLDIRLGTERLQARVEPADAE